jgi:signal transduction histidine kinase
MNELAAASIVILLGLTGAHGYVYTLHGRKFFAYLAAAWLANLLYILVETWTATSGIDEFSKILAVSAVSAISTVFFFFALADLLHLTPKQRAYLGASLATFVVASAVTVFIPTHPFAAYRAEILTAGVAVVTTTILLWLGVSLLRLPTDRMLAVARDEDRPEYSAPKLHNREGHSKDLTAVSQHSEPRPLTTDVRRTLRIGRIAFACTFLAYACLQPFYPLQWRILDDVPGLLRSLFWVGLVIKVVHGAALPLIFLADFRDTAEALRERSVAEELGVLTASIEHDIKSPLALIHKEIDNIKAQYQHISYLTERLNRILEHATRISAAASIIPATREMVEHFHQFAEVLNMVAIVRGAVAAVKKVDKRGDVKIELETSRSEILVYGDRARLTQAFVNLLNNAVESCRDAQRHSAYVEIYCLFDGGRRECDVVIVDHGAGIPESNLAKIGRPFFSTKTSRGQNRGIGVFMASRVVRLHGGTLQFQSDGASFTVVTVTFPVATRNRKELAT